MTVNVQLVKGAGLNQAAMTAFEERLNPVPRDALAGYVLTQRKLDLRFPLETLANEITTLCSRVYGDDVLEAKSRGMAEDHEFDAGVIRILADHWIPDELGFDPDFWNAFALMYAPRPIYGFRHAPVSKKNPKFNTENLVSKRVYEHYYGRHWLRLAMTRDGAGNLDLEMAQRGSAEFWRSHIFRQKAVWSPKIVRAFLLYQYPAEDRRRMHESSKADVCDGVRLFIKYLVSSTSQHCLDILTESQLIELFEGLVSAGNIEVTEDVAVAG